MVSNRDERAERRSFLFRYTSPGMQAEEARLNLEEALAFLRPHVAEPREEPLAETAAGTCFRRVTALLDGRGG